MNTYIKSTEKSQINDLMLHLKLLEKTRTIQTQNKWKKKNNKNKGQIQQNRNQKTTQRINETKSWFFEKINKIDKSLENLTKMRR
jgi:hypothetical protein